MREHTTFDTHAAIKALMNEGVKEKQAEVYVGIIQDSRDSNSATKTDIVDLKIAISNINTQIANVKIDILKWILPFLMAIILAIFFK